MTEKRFKIKYINEQHISANLYDDKTFIGSIVIGEELIVELLNNLSEENEQLKQYLKQIQDSLWTTEHIKKLEKENEQLKKRNDRQAKQLDRLYHLIEEKDWRTLTDILDDFKRCEEQLQKEWGTYGDGE